MTAKDIVDRMMSEDRVSQNLGMDILHIEEGKCQLKMLVQEQMVNGFGIAHGGITFSLADSALAFASNAYGQHCVSIETSIHHLLRVMVGDELHAFCSEINRGKSLGLYEVKIYNQENLLVAFFKGQVKILNSSW